MEAVGAIQGKGAKNTQPAAPQEADKPNEGPARKRLNSRPTCRSCHRSVKIWDFGPTDLAGRANKPFMIVAIARRCFGPMSSLVSLVSCASGESIALSVAAPTSTGTYWDTQRVGLIGLPFPGVELKMVPVESKYELRLRASPSRRAISASPSRA